MDVICYALNRLRPHYIVSHKGASRARRDSIELQQQTADVAAMIHEGLKRVNHNQRPNFAHVLDEERMGADTRFPVFNIPTIMGRLFSGSNFSPIAGVDVELLCNGKLVTMKDGNWHNPYRMVSNAEGTFSFWPAPATASKLDEHSTFSYTLRVSSPDYETLNHFFKIPVISEKQADVSFSLERTYKLPDLYMFPPGEAEENEQQD
jgi:competence protein ComFB